MKEEAIKRALHALSTNVFKTPTPEELLKLVTPPEMISYLSTPIACTDLVISDIRYTLMALIASLSVNSGDKFLRFHKAAFTHRLNLWRSLEDVTLSSFRVSALTLIREGQSSLKKSTKVARFMDAYTDLELLIAMRDVTKSIN